MFRQHLIFSWKSNVKYRNVKYTDSNIEVRSVMSKLEATVARKDSLRGKSREDPDSDGSTVLVYTGKLDYKLVYSNC